MGFWFGTDLWHLTLQSATALLLVSVGGYLPMRTGVLVIGAEGTMLLGCFGAVAAETVTGGGPFAGVLGGVLASTAASALFALVAVTARVNVIVTGIALNFVAAGGTAVLTAVLFSASGSVVGPTLTPLPAVDVPGLSAVAWLGPVLSGQTWLMWLAVLAVPVAGAWLRHTRTGLTARVVGSSPDVAAAVGRSAVRIRWATLLAGGALTGLGAAQLALASVAQFSPGMTAGRGFIALALLLVAATRPWVLLPLAVVFAYFDTLGFNLQNVGLPTELSGVLPYVAIVALLSVPGIAARFLRAPDSAGRA